jgi:hypothetical protein
MSFKIKLSIRNDNLLIFNLQIIKFPLSFEVNRGGVGKINFFNILFLGFQN